MVRSAKIQGVNLILHHHLHTRIVFIAADKASAEPKKKKSKIRVYSHNDIKQHIKLSAILKPKILNPKTRSLSRILT